MKPLPLGLPILVTKVTAPPLRPQGVVRPRLMARLDDAFAKPLTLISAPAGSGKTTLVSQWLSGMTNDRLPKPAWLSLDRDDNDPTRFLAYLIAAFHTIEPTLGQGALALLQSPIPPPPKTIVTPLLNESSNLKSPILLVLDDYHLVTSPAVHEAVAFFLDRLPPNLHLILTTREDPPLPLARLRARNQLAELRAEDLRFTPAEAAQFLKQVMGLNLPVGDVAALEQRTEGWIAGLQLAALAMQAPLSRQERAGAARFIQTFAGTHAHVADYLATEVFQRQPPAVQEFLLQTCHLERLCGALCDAVTLRLDGQELLERLQKANLFLVPLDDERRWFRYHALFADFLRTRLPQRYSSEQRAELHRHASLWHEAQGAILGAIDHALAAADFDRVARLIDAAAEGWLRRGEVTTLFDKLAALPDEVTRANGQLYLWKAWALTLTGHAAEVEPWLRLAELQFIDYKRRAETEQECQAALLWNYRTGYGQATAIRATLALNQDNYPIAIELAQRALDLLPRNDLVLPSLMELTLGQAYLAQGQITAACGALEQAVKDSHAAGHPYIHIGALTTQARAHALLGDLPRARAAYEQALRSASDNRLPHLSAAAAQGLSELSERVSSLPAHPVADGLIEALNPHELEILRLLARGLSNADIARERGLAVSTVRWYVKHIYQKMGVHNRTQAVIRAGALKLI